MSIEWLDSEVESINNETVYPVDKFKARYEVEEIDGGGWLVLNWDTDRLWLQFAVLDFHSSNGDDTDVKASCVFHGDGPSKNLRECRHTYWGEEGYLFYPNGVLITNAFKLLSKYFDGLEKK